MATRQDRGGDEAVRRRPYAGMRLVRHGTVEELTHGGKGDGQHSSAGTPDGHVKSDGNN